MEEKSTALTTEQKSVFFNPDFRAYNLDLRDKIYPPVINILQSDKQYTAFADSKPSELVDHHGKLFVRTDINKPSDLKDEIVGTVIKIESGHEVRDLEENKIISSDSRILSAEEKEEHKAQGYKPMNMVKILLALGTAKEVQARLEVFKKGLEQGTATKDEFPFGVVVIKGASWGQWFETMNEMDELSRKALGKPFKEVATTIFKFKVTSQEEKSDSFGKYYSVKVTPEINDYSEAKEMAPLVMTLKDVGLFYKVGERVQEPEVVSAQEKFDSLDTPVKIEDAGLVEDVDIDNMPF